MATWNMIWQQDKSIFLCSIITSWLSKTKASTIQCAAPLTALTPTFLADPDNPFRKSMVGKILTREGDTASISCLATDPSLDNLRLETCSSRALASGLQFSASLEKGITIFNTRKSYEGCYVCTGRLKEENVRSFQYNLIVRPGKVD